MKLLSKIAGEGPRWGTPQKTLRGFSLVELLVVMGLTSILAVLVQPVFNSVLTSGKLSQAASDISSLLSQARAYAMAKNTYVYVGFQEVDGVQPSSATGIGRVAVVVVASLNGSRPYSTGPITAADVAVINAPQFFNGTHLTDSTSLVNGAMTARPTAAVDMSKTTATTTFSWPLNETAKYNFAKVIEFDPQGVARVQTSTAYSPSIQPYIEIPLVTAYGDAPSANISNQAAIQVDGITGAVAVYRP